MLIYILVLLSFLQYPINNITTQAHHQQFHGRVFKKMKMKYLLLFIYVLCTLSYELPSLILVYLVFYIYTCTTNVSAKIVFLIGLYYILLVSFLCRFFPMWSELFQFILTFIVVFNYEYGCIYEVECMILWRCAGGGCICNYYVHVILMHVLATMLLYLFKKEIILIVSPIMSFQLSNREFYQRKVYQTYTDYDSISFRKSNWEYHVEWPTN